MNLLMAAMVGALVFMSILGAYQSGRSAAIKDALVIFKHESEAIQSQNKAMERQQALLEDQSVLLTTIERRDEAIAMLKECR